MKLQFTFRLLFVIAAALPLRAQTFTFADTYPTNNLDSLENWVKTHPQPTEERLKNLIRLTRTYGWSHPDNVKPHTAEIERLAADQHHSAATAFVKLNKISLSQRNEKDYKTLLETKKECTSLQDTSVFIYCLVKLIYYSNDDSGLKTGNTELAHRQLAELEQIFTTYHNEHDYLLYSGAKFMLLFGKPNSNYAQLQTMLQKQISISQNNPPYAYALNVLESDLAITYYYQNKYEASYQTNKRILNRLKKQELSERIRVMTNMANDCEFTGRYDERIRLNEEALSLIRKNYKKPNLSYISNIYLSLKEEWFRKEAYKKAALYADSVIQLSDTLTKAYYSQSLLDLQEKYQTVEKQKQIANLTLQQTQTENRNHLILILLGIAVVAAIAFGFLGMRLRQANARLQRLTQARDQFFGIVAHDLRRPMFAFQNIKALVSFHLRKQNYAAIEKLSIALDESGIRLQKMLDNLVAWAMSQQETLPYQPQNLGLRERVQTIVDLYSGVNLLKNVRFTVDIPETLTAYADPNGFDLIVRNLIDNSFKALSKEGHLRITARHSENQDILLIFEDNAGGMTAEVLATVQSVFDAPERAQIGEKNMGMGLIMVGRFVKRNRGRIQVQSIAGQGTTFRIGLPKDAPSLSV